MSSGDFKIDWFDKKFEGNGNAPSSDDRRELLSVLKRRVSDRTKVQWKEQFEEITGST